jgi:hypothetical protein
MSKYSAFVVFGDSYSGLSSAFHPKKKWFTLNVTVQISIDNGHARAPQHNDSFAGKFDTRSFKVDVASCTSITNAILVGDDEREYYDGAAKPAVGGRFCDGRKLLADLLEMNISQNCFAKNH